MAPPGLFSTVGEVMLPGGVPSVGYCPVNSFSLQLLKKTATATSKIKLFFIALNSLILNIFLPTGILNQIFTAKYLILQDRPKYLSQRILLAGEGDRLVKFLRVGSLRIPALNRLVKGVYSLFPSP